ncbi:MAG: hypothetical protein RSE41_06120 [Clostridia bacterium]
MIVVKINYRNNEVKEMNFDTKEDMGKYISDNVGNIKDFRILNDGRIQIKIETTDGKKIYRPIDEDDLLEGLCNMIESVKLEQERIKTVHIIRPKKVVNND